MDINIGNCPPLPRRGMTIVVDIFGRGNPLEVNNYFAYFVIDSPTSQMFPLLKRSRGMTIVVDFFGRGNPHKHKKWLPE